MFFSGTLQEKLNGWKDVEKSFIRGFVICLAFKCAGKLLLCTKVLKSHAIFGKNGKNSRNTNFENKRKAWWCGRDDFGSFGLTVRQKKRNVKTKKFSASWRNQPVSILLSRTRVSSRNFSEKNRLFSLFGSCRN